MSGLDLKEMSDALLAGEANARNLEDSLLNAIAAIAAAGNMTIMPGSHMFGTKPVIMLPQAMYDRLCEIYPEKK